MENTPAPKPFEISEVDGRCVVTWRQLGNHERGTAYPLPPCPNFMYEFAGRFSTTGSAAIEGSLTGGTFHLLRDDRGQAVYGTDARMGQSNQSPRLVRPFVLGDPDTNVTVTISFAA